MLDKPFVRVSTGRRYTIVALRWTFAYFGTISLANDSGRSTSSGILSTISRGKCPWHIFALLYGVGKSFWASDAPRPIFIGAEKGTERLDVARFPQTDSIGELLVQVRALQTEKQDFDSVVLDSLDWVEPLIWKAVEFMPHSNQEYTARRLQSQKHGFTYLHLSP